jgi:hypothetical protein
MSNGWHPVYVLPSPALNPQRRVAVSCVALRSGPIHVHHEQLVL